MKRVLIYALLAVALTYVIRELLYIGIRKNEGGEFDKLNTAFVEENNFDILIIGSSRAECQFYPPIIDSATGLHSYNIGMTGAVMPFIAASLEAYLENSKAPKYVVLNMDLHSLGDATDTVYKFPRYFAYLNNSALYSGLSQCDSRFPAFRWASLYSMPYFGTKYLSNSLHGWMGIPTEYDSEYEQGFAPCKSDPRMQQIDSIKYITTHAVLSPEIKNAIERINKICAENNIKLILTVSPLFHLQEKLAVSYDISKQELNQYAIANKIPWIDLGHDSIRFRSEFYGDPAHLNKQGALIFTRHFCSVLQQYLNP
ncbi:MAG: hypothetical protein RL007_2558 [Bacteroidota bacterium]|jgi:hypothetical protein